MFRKLKNSKKLIIAIIIISNSVFAEVDSIPQSQLDIDNIKPLNIQKQDKSSSSKTTLLKSSKTTKYNKGYFGALKLLIPASLR